ncbi:MAG: FtsX-like permease family protein, partial [Ascidiaceihabitans sp.]
MSLATAAKFAKRELRGGIKGFRIFLACLALGVAAIAAVGSVRSGIEAGLAREGAAILGGDAELDFTYRFATADERAWMDTTATRVSEIADFRSMAVVGEERALTQIKAIDDAYPLVGTVGLMPEMPLDVALADYGAVMERVLSDRLGLSVGDTFALGTQDFTLRAILTREPDGAASGFSLGPRTIAYTEALKDAQLLTSGSLFETKYRLKLEEGADLEALETAAKARFEDTGMRWTDARNGAPGVAQFVNRLGAFLVLVGLSGLAVGGVGVSAAVRSYLSDKTGVIATLRTLGAERSTIFQTYFIQIGVLSLLGIAIGVALGALVPAALAPLIEARLPIPSQIGIYPAPLAEAALYGLLTAFVFTLWPLARAENVRAATLFRDGVDTSSALPALKYIFFTGLGLAALIGLAGFFSGTWRLTLWTAGGIAGALLLLSVTAVIIRWTSRRGAAVSKGRPALRWALASISGPREGAASVVLSLGLGLSVLAAVGQIDGNLRGAITTNLPDVAPSYFFVDIQRDQMPGYTERLENDPAVSRIDSAPMLRGVITKINDTPAREYSGEHWVIQGDRAVTYAERPSENTKITEGAWWDKGYVGPPQISFAAEEAEEMGLKLNDTLTINVLGRDITGTITSFRDVDFSTGEMGFVLTMNPAALQGAPHTFISTVYADENAEAQIL